MRVSVFVAAPELQVVAGAVIPLANGVTVHVVGTSENPEQAVRLSEALRPNVLLVGDLPGVSAEDLARRIKAVVPATRVILYRWADPEVLKTQAVITGINGLISRTASVDDTLLSICGVALGETPLTAVQEAVATRPAPSFPGSIAVLNWSTWAYLTQREKEVAALRAQGLTVAEIAKRLGLSESTANTHLKRVHSKLRVTTRQELRDLLLFGKVPDG